MRLQAIRRRRKKSRFVLQTSLFAFLSFRFFWFLILGQKIRARKFCTSMKVKFKIILCFIVIKIPLNASLSPLNLHFCLHLLIDWVNKLSTACYLVQDGWRLWWFDLKSPEIWKCLACFYAAFRSLNYFFSPISFTSGMTGREMEREMGESKSFDGKYPIQVLFTIVFS